MLLVLCLLCSVEGASFGTAAEARLKMEERVSKYAQDLEASYTDMTSAEGAACSGKYVPSCDPNGQHSGKWNTATALSQFNNPTTGTCTRFDKDENNEFITEVTGRKSACSIDRNSCKAPDDTQIDCTKGDADGAFSAQYNSRCKCHYNIVTEDFKLHADSTSLKNKATYLDDTNCTSSSNINKCSVNKDEMGINTPAEMGPENQRVCSEIVATSMLQSQFKANSELYDDINWNFMGLQETGLYRNWPLIYQCRTEAQCSGCSDPRFRNWYAAAASGPKDVVLVLNTSGSMGKANRFVLMQKAAKWVTNTLTKYDTATIVDFSSVARKMDWGGGNYKMHKMDDVGRAKMKDHIDELSAFGR
jgi:hypothetical protein